MSQHMTDIGNLPSNFFPYKYKSLRIRPFVVRDMRLMSKALVTQDITPMIEAVGNAIDQDVMKLTVGDYYYVLAWLRLYSSTKSPWIVDWNCTELYLKHKTRDEFVLNNQPWPEDPEILAQYEQVKCGTHNTFNAHISQLEVIQLDDAEPIILPPGFDWPRVDCIKESREALTNPELNMIVSAATWISTEGVQFPPEMADATEFQKKLWILESQEDLDMFDTARALNDTIDHGIREHCVIECRSCRQRHEHKISLDALSFFR